MNNKSHNSQGILMKPEFQYTQTGDTKTGNGFIVRKADRKMSIFCVPELSVEFAEIGTLENGLAAALEHLQGRSLDGYGGKAFDFEASNQLARLKPTLAAALSGIQARNTKHAARRIEMLSFNLDAQPNQYMRHELRDWFMSHDMPSRIQLMNGADYALSVSILEGGQALAGVDAEIWNRFLDRAVAAIHIQKVGLDNDHRLKPSEENLTALGIDQKAVMKAATDAVARYHAETDLLKLAEAYLQSVVRALMLITGKSFDEIVF